MKNPIYPGENNSYCEIKDVMIPMRDGIHLAAEINFPAVNGEVDLNKQYPVIMAITPYMNCPTCYRGAIFDGADEYAVDNGYAMVIVAARGTGNSEGVFQQGANEGWGTEGRPDHKGWGTHMDGVDLFHWLVKQPWCNGKIFTLGHSYVGASQILPILTGELPGFQTAVVGHPAVNSGYSNWPIANGLLNMELASNWIMTLLPDQLLTHRYAPAIEKAIYKDLADLGYEINDPYELYGFMADWPNKWFKKYGLLNAPVLRHLPNWKMWIENKEDVDFFSYNNTWSRRHDFDQPCLFYGGWYDLFLENTIKCYEQSVADAPDPETAGRHHLVISAANHGTRVPSEKRFRDEDNDLPAMSMDWYSWQQHEESSEIFDKAPVLMYVLGEECWAAEQAWPLPDAVDTAYYLHSEGSANTLFGDGTLSTEKPGAEVSDTYTDDPHDPVHSMLENGIMAGMQDHSENEKRSDVLVYTTPVLEEDTEVTGWIKARLFVSTTGTDADFIMKLTDVYPDGSSMILVAGAARGRYRKDRYTPMAMVPGEIAEIEIPLRATSNVFKKGHRIRIEVMSRNVPLYEPNPNAFIDMRKCTEEDYVIADHTVYHDDQHPSCIVLPVVPAGHKREWITEWPFNPEKTGFMDERDANAKMHSAADRSAQPVVLDASILPVTE